MYASTPIFGTLHEGSPHARKAAAEVLAVIGRGSPLVVEHLTQAMSDPDESVRAAVARGLTAVLGRR
jgi:HEAT repeat protein